MENYFKEFKKKIKGRKVNIAVIGLGYVGLPLAVEFAKKRFSVTGIDLDKDRVKKIKAKTSYITDVPSSGIKKIIDSGYFKASADFSLLKHSDVIIICVPTPLKSKYYPDISFILSAVKGVKKFLQPNQLIILESTTYPGTTEEILKPILESGGLKCGKDFYLAFSPERIDPGNKKYPVYKIPKVMGGITPQSTELTAALYRNIVSKVVPVSSARVAETVKLLENTFRIVNIALIDEMAMMAHKMNIDIWEIIEAAKTKPFGFMPFYPGPGVGGHCIPKDPLYLYWKAKHHGFESRFIKLSSGIINYMPLYVTERLRDILSDNKINLADARILIVGVSYKKDVLDLRKSPALDIIGLLSKKNIKVSYYDPLVPYLKFGRINLKSIKLNSKELKKYDCVIITADHSRVDYNFILKNSPRIFDTRNIYKGVEDRKIIRL
ncbi:MAG: nucleotide sugar dehydrogenase [Candidatus Omnitrophota bacterium]